MLTATQRAGKPALIVPFSWLFAEEHPILPIDISPILLSSVLELSEPEWQEQHIERGDDQIHCVDFEVVHARRALTRGYAAYTLDNLPAGSQ